MELKREFLVALLIGIFGIIFQVALQASMREYAKEKIYFQEWSSEALMHTVSIEDLRDTPFLTINNIHVQPPALDIIRAIFVHIWPSNDISISLKHVDILLYRLWTIIYSAIGVIIYLWSIKLTAERSLILKIKKHIEPPAGQGNAD